MGVDDSITYIVALRPRSANWYRRHRSIITLGTDQGEGRYRWCDFIFSQGRQNPLSAESHVSFDSQQVRRVTSVGTIRRRFHHPSAVLRNPVASLDNLLIFRLLPVQLLHDLGKKKDVRFGSVLLTAEADPTYFFCSKRQPNFLGLWVNMKYAVFNLVSPQQLITSKVFHPIVRRNELSYSSASNIPEILFRVVPRFGDTNLQETYMRTG